MKNDFVRVIYLRYKRYNTQCAIKASTLVNNGVKTCKHTKGIKKNVYFVLEIKKYRKI